MLLIMVGIILGGQQCHGVDFVVTATDWDPGPHTERVQECLDQVGLPGKFLTAFLCIGIE